MMAEARSSALDDQNLLKSVECPICIEVYENPKTLQCGHSLCSSCVQGLPRETPSTVSSGLSGPSGRLFGGAFGVYMLRCPVCRQLTKIPEGGLPTNFVLQGVISRVRELQGKVVTCHVCGQRTPFDAQMVCESCAEEVNEANIFCISCAIAGHANKGHKIAQRSTAFMDQRQESLRNIHMFASSAQKTVESCAKTAFEASSVLSDVEFLSSELARFSEVISEVEAYQCPTKRLLTERVSHMQRLSNLFEKVGERYEKILTDAVARICELRSETAQCFGEASNAADPLDPQSFEDAEAFGELRISAAEQPQLPNIVNPAPFFNYERSSPNRDQKVRRRAALIARRRPGTANQGASSSVAASSK